MPSIFSIRYDRIEREFVTQCSFALYEGGPDYSAKKYSQKSDQTVTNQGRGRSLLRSTVLIGLTNRSFESRQQLRGKQKTMSLDKSSEENVQNHTEAYFEELASQEEIYLEEIEERARAVLIAEKPSSLELSSHRGSPKIKRSVTDASNAAGMAESVDEQLDRSAEELITGDSDDPPLSEEAVAEMLRTKNLNA